MNQKNPPNPDTLLAEAQQATAKVRLEDYRETVLALREKNYSWRDISDFLNERGVSTDHTRVYRLFSGAPEPQRRHEERAVDVARMTYLGEQPTKKGTGTWNTYEIELPSKLGANLTVKGFAWRDAKSPAVGEGNSVDFRDAKLLTRTQGRGFPMAYLRADIQDSSGDWAGQEIYIVPQWEAML